MDANYFISKMIRKIFNQCAVKNSTIDKSACCDYGSIVLNSNIGKCSYIGEHTSLIYSKVGNFTSISNYCAIGGGAHPINWVSTSPVFNSSKSILNISMARSKFDPFTETLIGNDVWIGSHCLIKAGITIADGAIIGMGSVVTKDVPPYEIWAGNPAKILKKRFDDEIIKKLLEIKWWEWQFKKLKYYAPYFNDIKKFIYEVYR